MLRRAADLLRQHQARRWLDYWGDGSWHGVDIGRLLKEAWAELDGEVDVEPEDLPGAETLAGVLRSLPPDTSRVSVGYAFTEWAINSSNDAETTLERVEIAIEAASEEGRARRERAR